MENGDNANNGEGQGNELPMGGESDKTKAELFAENSDRFEDLKDCLLVVKIDPETKKLMILNQCRNFDESFIIEGYVKESMIGYRTALRIKAAKTQDIVKPNGMGNPHGIMDFIRKKR